MIYISTNDGTDLALHQIASIARTSAGYEIHTIDGHCYKTTAGRVERPLITIIRVEGWEQLTYCHGKGHRPESLGVQPVIALGLTVHGEVRSITPLDACWEDESHGLRKTGDPTVYAYDAIYADAWLAEQQADFDQSHEAEETTSNAYE